MVQSDGTVVSQCIMALMQNIIVSCGSVVVSKHGLYAGGLGSIPTTITTMTAAGGDAEHVSLNH